MRRYVLTALTLGSAVTVVVLALELAGAFETLLIRLGGFYGAAGVTSETLEPIKWPSIPLVATAAFGMAWCVIDVSRLFQKVLIALSGIVVIAGISPTLAFYGYLVDPFAPLAAAVLAAIAGFAYGRTEQGMRKRLLEDVLGPRISGATFHALLEGPDPPDFKGAAREVTVVTCRLLHYEGLQNHLEPADLMRLSNLFLRSTTTFLLSRGGYLDESSPELIRVSFGMLTPTEDHASQACRAALDLRGRLRRLSQECETRWFQPLHCGVGITTGLMTVGVYGTPGHFRFSGIGQVTDFSRRLAHANLRYGSDLLIGPETYRQIRSEMAVRPMEMFYDPATNVMSEIYQLLSRNDQISEEENRRRELFWQGVIFLREKNFEAALDCFSRSRLPGSDDGPTTYFISLSQEGVAGPAAPASRLVREMTEEGHARLISML